MKHIFIFLISIFTAYSGISQIKVCEPKCAGQTFTVNAACSFDGDSPSDYTYSISNISSWGTAINNLDGSFTITINQNVTGTFFFDIICECPILTGCDKLGEFSIDVGGEVTYECEFETLGDGSNETFVDGNEGGCMHRVCLGQCARVRFFGVGGGSAAYGAPLNTTVSPPGTWVTICNPTNTENDIVIPVTITNADGCTVDTEVVFKSKDIEMLDECDQ